MRVRNGIDPIDDENYMSAVSKLFSLELLQCAAKGRSLTATGTKIVITERLI